MRTYPTPELAVSVIVGLGFVWSAGHHCWVSGRCCAEVVCGPGVSGAEIHYFPL